MFAGQQLLEEPCSCPCKPHRQDHAPNAPLPPPPSLPLLSHTLPQLLVYDALGFTPPAFGHMSLILAPDKSKLSKRHGATSVGDFKAQVGGIHRVTLTSQPGACAEGIHAHVLSEWREVSCCCVPC